MLDRVGRTIRRIIHAYGRKFQHIADIFGIAYNPVMNAYFNNYTPRDNRDDFCKTHSIPTFHTKSNNPAVHINLPQTSTDGISIHVKDARSTKDSGHPNDPVDNDSPIWTERNPHRTPPPDTSTRQHIHHQILATSVNILRSGYDQNHTGAEIFNRCFGDEHSIGIQRPQRVNTSRPSHSDFRVYGRQASRWKYGIH
ncbi:hypothetical protein C8R43DRAFT_942433 [Mycena crocata]|nr:hypothetical protein C8R43DRAFT_942433 [Mycena crocata]